MAGLLSRFFNKDTQLENEIPGINDMVPVHSLNIRCEICKEFRAETDKDSVLLKLKKILQDEWPKDGLVFLK